MGDYKKSSNSILNDTIKILSQTRDITIRLEERMKSIDEKLKFFPCIDHENRIRETEKWRWKAIGIFSVVMFIITIIINKLVV